MACANGCLTRNPFCDVCDSDLEDPNTGWGGFKDHWAKKDFKDREEQGEWYKKRREQGLPVERDVEDN